MVGTRAETRGREHCGLEDAFAYLSPEIHGFGHTLAEDMQTRASSGLAVASSADTKTQSERDEGHHLASCHCLSESWPGVRTYDVVRNI